MSIEHVPTHNASGLEDLLLTAAANHSRLRTWESPDEQVATLGSMWVAGNRPNRVVSGLDGMAVLVVPQGSLKNIVYCRSGKHWANVTNATASELRDFSLQLNIPQPGPVSVSEALGTIAGVLLVSLLKNNNRLNR